MEASNLLKNPHKIIIFLPLYYNTEAFGINYYLQLMHAVLMHFTNIMVLLRMSNNVMLHLFL